MAPSFLKIIRISEKVLLRYRNTPMSFSDGGALRPPPRDPLLAPSGFYWSIAVWVGSPSPGFKSLHNHAI